MLTICRTVETIGVARGVSGEECEDMKMTPAKLNLTCADDERRMGEADDIMVMRDEWRMRLQIKETISLF